MTRFTVITPEIVGRAVLRKWIVKILHPHTQHAVTKSSLFKSALLWKMQRNGYSLSAQSLFGKHGSFYCTAYVWAYQASVFSRLCPKVNEAIFSEWLGYEATAPNYFLFPPLLY